MRGVHLPRFVGTVGGTVAIGEYCRCSFHSLWSSAQVGQGTVWPWLSCLEWRCPLWSYYFGECIYLLLLEFYSVLSPFRLSLLLRLAGLVVVGTLSGLVVFDGYTL